MKLFLLCLGISEPLNNNVQRQVNSVDHADGAWGRMFHYFQFRQQEFYDHYHKRSNVESTFSAIKRKFGDHVRSRSPVAMVNEVLAKILSHNIVVNIHEQAELGIESVFWPEKSSVQNDVLPLVQGAR